MKFQDLLAYRKGFDLAMKILSVSKSFPKEETYSLTDQIRRSSRSVCANMAEAYRKRLYPKHFISKLTDCDAENSETQTWLEFSLASNYISTEQFNELTEQSIEVGKLINYMIRNPEKFGSHKI
ncbi:four helix bundle protein [Winogradskyella thalassocola]|uniref:Four helix bundle protein n=1 Tax=Winogradskyella thalassocola TaxID=262004 RepID=A0A1G8IRP4_9FLAO|nr:four helix bundle protein [Winogradskyella thalassocola]SDI21695.1 four helix bundle protein [Winogradskyella thalassocola]